MKPFYLCILSLFLLYSCDETTDMESKSKTPSNSLLNHRTGEAMYFDLPINQNNPYDYVGQLHFELYQDYYATQPDSLLSFEQVLYNVEGLANKNSNFNLIARKNYYFSNVIALEQLLGCKTLCLDTVLAQSSLSFIAQYKTKDFFQNFNGLFEKNLESEPVLEYITQFENEIITSAILSVSDKSIILSATSIARYSTYESKRRPKKNTDPDWDSLITSLYVAFLGDENSVGDRIVASLVCGIKTNE